MRDLDINMDMMRLIGYLNELAIRAKRGFVPNDVAEQNPGFYGSILYDKSRNLNDNPDNLMAVYEVVPQPPFRINGKKVYAMVEYVAVTYEQFDHEPAVYIYIGDDFDADMDPAFVVEKGYWYDYWYGL